MPKEEHTCERCNTSFYAWKCHSRRYCSNRCAKLGHAPWNKGVSWSEESKKKMSLSHLGKKNPHKGVPRTKETRLKISKAMIGHIKKPSTREKHRKNMIYKMKNGIISNEDTQPERLVENYLLFNDILYLKQFRYDLGVADFWIPEENIIIECDGEYWHKQPNISKRDSIQTKWLEDNDYIVYRFTDKEIKDSVEECLASIF